MTWSSGLRSTAARRSPTAAAITGNFVYVDRGTCSFDIKADFAEAAGATGIIVGNNVPARRAGWPVRPGSPGS